LRSGGERYKITHPIPPDPQTPHLITPHEFIAKWKPVTLTERSACQQHFLDLCEVLDRTKPDKAEPEGAFYTFERGVRKSVPGAGGVRDAARG